MNPVKPMVCVTASNLIAIAAVIAAGKVKLPGRLGTGRCNWSRL